MEKKDKINKLLNFDSKHKVYCDNPMCSEHGTVFYNSRIDRIPCVNCGHWIYKDEKTKLKYKMKERGINVK